MTHRTERPDPWEEIAAQLYLALRALERRYNDRKGIPYTIAAQVQAAIHRYETEAASVPNSNV